MSPAPLSAAARNARRPAALSRRLTYTEEAANVERPPDGPAQRRWTSRYGALPVVGEPPSGLIAFLRADSLPRYWPKIAAPLPSRVRIEVSALGACGAKESKRCSASSRSE